MPPRHAIPHLTPRNPHLTLGARIRLHASLLLLGAIGTTVGIAHTIIFAVANSGGDVTLPPALVSLIGLLIALVGAAGLLVAAARIARDTAILRYGQLAPARIERVSEDPTLRINNRPATRLDLRWTAPDGQQHTAHRRIFDKHLIEDHPQGLELPILIDPLQPDVFVVPTLYNADFGDLRTPEDRRLDHTTPYTNLREPPQAAHHTLTPPITLIPSGWWTLLSRRRKKNLPTYALHLHSERLTLLEAEREAATIDLSRPFALHLTTWLLDDHTARLHLRLHQRGAPPNAPSLTISVDLPQERVDRHVPLQQRDAPRLDELSFNELWNTLSFYANLHGEQLAGIATPQHKAQPQQANTLHRQHA